MGAKKKYQTKIEKILEKPNEKYQTLNDHYEETMAVIYPFYDYLDTDERKIIENFGERFSEYGEILEYLKERAKFNIEEKE